MTDYLYPDGRVLIFSKTPIPGTCKTRLIPALGARRAAEIQRRLLVRTLETIALSRLAPVELWSSPSIKHSVLRQARLRYSLRLKVQPKGDLGARMSYALRQSLKGSAYAVIVGTDCPALTPRHIRQALDTLASGRRVVLGPAEDGGYVLVGTRTNCPALFRRIPWGSHGVMAATRRRLARLGVGHTELPALWDVDRPADLRRALALGLL